MGGVENLINKSIRRYRSLVPAAASAAGRSGGRGEQDAARGRRSVRGAAAPPSGCKSRVYITALIRVTLRRPFEAAPPHPPTLPPSITPRAGAAPHPRLLLKILLSGIVRRSEIIPIIPRRTNARRRLAASVWARTAAGSAPPPSPATK